MIQRSGLSSFRIATDFGALPAPTPAAEKPTSKTVVDGIEPASTWERTLGLSQSTSLQKLEGLSFESDIRPNARQALELSPGFTALPAGIRDRMLGDVERAPESLQSLRQMAASESFRRLPEDTQAWAVYELSKHPNLKGPTRPGLPEAPSFIPANARKTITDLATLGGLGQLNGDDQIRLLKDVGGRNPLSARAREAIGNELPTLKSLDDASAAASLRTFLSGQTSLPDGARDVFAPRGPAKPFTLGAGVDVTAGVGKDEAAAPAKRYAVNIDGRTINVTIAEPPPANSPTADTVAQSLAMMTTDALRYTKDVFISGDTTRGGGANGGNGKIIIFPGFADQDALNRLMSHEAGHIFSDTMLGDWTSDNRWNDWQSAIASDGLYPSDYAHRTSRDDVHGPSGRHNPAEDFAEAQLTYWSVKGTPQEAEMRELMPARFAMLDRLSAEANLKDIAAGLIRAIR